MAALLALMLLLVKLMLHVRSRAVLHTSRQGISCGQWDRDAAKEGRGERQANLLPGDQEAAHVAPRAFHKSSIIKGYSVS